MSLLKTLLAAGAAGLMLAGSAEAQTNARRRDNAPLNAQTRHPEAGRGHGDRNVGVNARPWAFGVEDPRVYGRPFHVPNHFRAGVVLDMPGFYGEFTYSNMPGFFDGNMWFPFGCLPPRLSRYERYILAEGNMARPYLNIGQQRAMRQYAPMYGCGPSPCGPEYGAVAPAQSRDEIPDAEISKLREKLSLLRQIREEEGAARPAPPAPAPSPEVRDVQSVTDERVKQTHRFKYDKCIARNQVPSTVMNFLNDYLQAIGENNTVAYIEGEGRGQYVQVMKLGETMYAVRVDKKFSSEPYFAMDDVASFAFDTAVRNHKVNPTDALKIEHVNYNARGCPVGLTQ